MMQLQNPKLGLAETNAGPTALLVNSQARQGQALYQQAQVVLQQAGVNLSSSQSVSDGRQIAAVTRDLIKSGVRTLIVGGGDGTVSTVVDYLVGREITLGLLPLGTGNDLAATLGIPSDLKAAAGIIANGKVSKIDLGVVNQNYYLNNAGVGIGTAIIAQTSNATKQVYGAAAYALTAIRNVLNYKPFMARLTFSNQVITTPAIQITISNGRFFGGGNLVEPDARIDDNELIVAIFEPMRVGELIQVGSLLRSGQYTRHPRVRIFRRVRHLQLEIIEGQQQRLYVDGEVWGHTPATFGIAPAAISVLQP